MKRLSINVISDNIDTSNDIKTSNNINFNGANNKNNSHNIVVDISYMENGEGVERESHGVPPEEADVVWYKSCRTCTAIMSGLGYTFFYLLRVNLSLAMVFMVADPSHNNSNIFDNHQIIINKTNSHFDNTSDISIDQSFDQSINQTFNQPFNQSSSDSMTINHNNSTLQSTLTPVIETFLHPNFTNTSSSHHHRHSISSSEIYRKDELIDECVGTKINKLSKKNKGEFLWSKEMTGYILCAFFYGYILTQFPGGWLATRFGTKHIFGGGMFISIIATFLTPCAARYHPYLLIAIRSVIGLVHGAGFPSTHVLYSLWFPPLERTRYITFAHAGTVAGAIIALSVSGFICDIPIDNGWPLIFYIYGFASLLWYLSWNYFVYNSPLDHPRIDPVERSYIVSKIGSSVYGGLGHHQGVPWSKILRSAPVWAIVVVHLGNNWANYTILVCIPLFMKEVLKFNTKENGVLSSLPYVLSFFISIGSGQLADLLIRKECLSTTNTRKLFQLLGSVIPAALLVAIGYVDCQSRYWGVFLLCLIVGTNSICRAGFMVNHVDIAPRYAGLLFGLSNTLATTPGMMTPIVVGKLTTTGTREEWMVVFNICAALLVASSIFYLIFGDGRLQKWAVPSSLVIPSGINVETKADQGDETMESLVTKL